MRFTSFPMTGVLLTWARRLLFAEGASRWVIVAIAVSYFGSDVFIPGLLLSLGPAIIVGIPALYLGLGGTLPRRGWPISAFLILNTLGGIVDMFFAFTTNGIPLLFFLVGAATLVSSILIALVAYPPDRLRRPLLIAARLLLLGDGVGRWMVASYMWPFIVFYGGILELCLVFGPALVVGVPAIFIAFTPKLRLATWQIWIFIVANALAGVLDEVVAVANYLPAWMCAIIGTLTIGSTVVLLVAAFRPQQPMVWFADARSG